MYKISNTTGALSPFLFSLGPPPSIIAAELLRQMDNYQVNNGSIANFPWPSLNIEGDLDLSRRTWLTSLPQGLHVGGNLYLSGCNGLTSLPQGLHVGGYLDLSGCNGLTSLPQGLHVGGNLNISGCTGLTSLPQGLHFGGYLYLSGCTRLTSLPQVRFDGDLYLRNCTGFTSLPQGLHVRGDLNLSGCTRLTSLPQGLYFGGSLDLSGCTGLTSLPQGLHFDGNLDLSGCTGLTSLPQGLYVRGDFNLSGCTRLTSLPQGLRVDGHLNLSRCTRLTSPPQGLHVGDYLNLNGCTGLTSLPQDLHVGSYAYLSGCTALISLPQGLQVGDSLNLSHRTGLISLPQGLHVRGDLNLSGCTGLTSLPQGLHVRGDLNLSGCTGLTSLPQGLYFDGDLDLSGCTGLTSLPTWITTLGPRVYGPTRHVDLTGTGLSQQIVQILQQTSAPGMQFHTGQAATTPTVTLQNLDLNKTLDFWLAASKDSSLNKPSLIINEHAQDVISFLSRLTATAEYNNPSSRPLLAKRVIAAFQCMQEDDQIQTRAIDIIYQGLRSCDDRIISALDEIEVMIRIYRLEKNGGSVEDLRKAGKSFLLLDMVNKKAKAFVKTLPLVDEIEVYLAFQIGLAERFDLPISTRNMIHRSSAQISDSDIAKKGDEIEKAYSDEELNKFLKTWSPWIVHQRRLSIPKYENLPIDDNFLMKKEPTCLITQNSTKYPVLYKTNVYDYEAFTKWFVLNGTDPTTREAIDIMQLRRVQRLQ